MLFANQRQLGAENLKQYATDLELDTVAFNACLDSAQYRDDVVQDYQEGSRFGVSGTPAFFINGRFISGAQPFETFQAIIDDELAR